MLQKAILSFHCKNLSQEVCLVFLFLHVLFSIPMDEFGQGLLGARGELRYFGEPGCGRIMRLYRR